MTQVEYERAKAAFAEVAGGVVEECDYVCDRRLAYRWLTLACSMPASEADQRAIELLHVAIRTGAWMNVRPRADSRVDFELSASRPLTEAEVEIARAEAAGKDRIDMLGDSFVSRRVGQQEQGSQ